MRLAVFADIHSNLEALEAFMAHAVQQRIDRYMCLGDIVGYGANPNECIDLVRSLPKVNIVLGNHDAAAVWMTSPYSMSKKATEAILWTAEQLTDSHAGFLKELKPTVRMQNMIFSHANAYNPMAWRYVIDRKYAIRSFSGVREKLQFIGHTHAPLVITRKNLFKLLFMAPDDSKPATVAKHQRQIINCGSIGQPRDGNPKACYSIYDTRTEQIEFHRFSYDYEKAGEKIINAGLPEFLARRLIKGR
jgi:diadenosine tetraphosphatase ApaH/serine/threonine PP2A family protein phosphatase